MDDLKPCPFCGSCGIEMAWPDGTTRHFVQCTGCGNRTSTHLASHGGSAKDEWNTRADDAEITRLGGEVEAKDKRIAELEEHVSLFRDLFNAGAEARDNLGTVADCIADLEARATEAEARLKEAVALIDDLGSSKEWTSIILAIEGYHERERADTDLHVNELQRAIRSFRDRARAARAFLEKETADAALHLPLG